MPLYTSAVDTAIGGLVSAMNASRPVTGTRLVPVPVARAQWHAIGSSAKMSLISDEAAACPMMQKGTSEPRVAPRLFI